MNGQNPDPQNLPANEHANAQPSKPERGTDVIARYLKTLPTTPGVYRMIDAAGEVIYVGKAKSLKARVTSYAREGSHTRRIQRMISATVSMEFVTVHTEAEALLLEANLIKRFRPRYNVVLRDDKSFPYILITRESRAPQLTKHRGARTGKGDYFGPFASAGAVNRTINVLQRAFLLRTCADSVFETVTRPCMLHQIKRCSAPCTREISDKDYAELVDEAEQFLTGESHHVREVLQRAMTVAADALEYEQAAVILPSGFRDTSDTDKTQVPVSITFLGGLYQEARVLAVAKAWQDATDFHLKHPVLVG